jgi:hypothetical protein
MRALLFCLLAASPLACLKSNAFTCDPNGTNACTGPGGRCEADGLCSINSSSCSSGREYDKSAGGKAGDCIGEGPGDDGGIDMAVTEGGVDMGIDGPQGCPSDFETIAAGQTGHKYKVISNTNTWSNQQNAQCNAVQTYMFIANDAAELAAVRAFAVSKGVTEVWHGAADQEGVPLGATEAKFVDVLTNLYVDNCASSCTTAGGITVSGNKNPDDCLFTKTDTEIEVKPCGENHPTVCECEE